jgi:hypothetical protein
LIVFKISKEKTIEDLMKELDKLYENPLTSNKVFLLKKFFDMNMSEDGSISDHLNEFNMVTNQLSYVGVKFDDEVRSLLILCSFPERWNVLVMVVSNSISSSNTLKFEDVVVVILREEMRWKITCETSSNSLTMENMGRQRERGKRPGNRGNSRKGRSKSILENIECWKFGNKWHMKKDCRSPKKQGDGQ